MFGLTWQQFVFLIVLIVIRFSLYSSKWKNFLIDSTFWKIAMLNDILTSLLQNIKYMSNIKWNNYHLNVKNVTYPSWREMCIILHFKLPFRSIIVFVIIIYIHLFITRDHNTYIVTCSKYIPLGLHKLYITVLSTSTTRMLQIISIMLHFPKFCYWIETIVKFRFIFDFLW